MNFRQRVLIITCVAGLGGLLYGLARYHMDDIMAHVVENALVQKLPPAADSKAVRLRFSAALAGLQSRDERIRWLLELSQYLEKRQVLNLEEVEGLLGSHRDLPAAGR